MKESTTAIMQKINTPGGTRDSAGLDEITTRQPSREIVIGEELLATILNTPTKGGPVLAPKS
ncbi:MAG: hypothetical protein WC785_03125 [Tatlockia sp.]|jgi:hypothetical protein